MLILVLYLREKRVRAGGKYVSVLQQNGFTMLSVEATEKIQRGIFRRPCNQTPYVANDDSNTSFSITVF